MLFNNQKNQRLSGLTAYAVIACVVIAGCGDNSSSSQTKTKTNTTNDSQSAQQTETDAPPVATSEPLIAPASLRPPLKWNTLPFITESDRIATVMMPALAAKSSAVEKFLTLIPFGDNTLRIAPEDTDWVAVYATPLVNDDDSFTASSTTVMKLNRPSSIYEIAESRFTTDAFEEAEMDGVSYLRAMERTSEDYIDEEGHKVAMAVFEYDENTFVICEEGRLPFILEQADCENSLRSLVADMAGDYHFLAAVDVTEDLMIQEAVVANAKALAEGSVLESLATNAKTMVVTLNLDADTMVHLSATTDSEEESQEIAASIAEFQNTASEFLKGMEMVMNADTTLLLTTGQRVLKELTVAREASTIDLKIKRPGDLVPFVDSLEAFLTQDVAAVEPPTSP